MKRLLTFLSIVVLLISNKVVASTVQDGFDGASIDSTLWQVLEPFPQSDVHQADGWLVMTGRGGLGSLDDFGDKLEIRGRLRFTGSSDHFKIVFRSDLSGVVPYVERLGV